MRGDRHQHAHVVAEAGVVRIERGGGLEGHVQLIDGDGHGVYAEVGREEAILRLRAAQVQGVGGDDARGRQKAEHGADDVCGDAVELRVGDLLGQLFQARLPEEGRSALRLQAGAAQGLAPGAGHAGAVNEERRPVGGEAEHGDGDAVRFPGQQIGRRGGAVTCEDGVGDLVAPAVDRERRRSA